MGNAYRLEHKIKGIRNMVRKDVLGELNKIITKDKFDDSMQGKSISVKYQNILEDFIYDIDKINFILDIGSGSGVMFDSINVTHCIEPNPIRNEQIDEQIKSNEVVVKQGYAENIPFNDNYFNVVICWGTFCYLRSRMEALYEMNRVLAIGGYLVFDVVLHSTLPICQTVEPESFLNWFELFGFKVYRRKIFGQDYDKRMAILAKKIADFDYKNFLFPQCFGQVNNFKVDRDWYLNKEMMEKGEN